MAKHPSDTLNFIAQILYDKKGANILALDVQGMSTITDTLLIADGNVDRHVASMARAVIDAVEERGGPPLLHVEGLKAGDWVVLDYGEIMIHLFMPGMREKYSLERLWADSQIIDLEIETSKPAVGDDKG